jgi:hypothetical protein
MDGIGHFFITPGQQFAVNGKMFDWVFTKKALVKEKPALYRL